MTKTYTTLSNNITPLTKEQTRNKTIRELKDSIAGNVFAICISVIGSSISMFYFLKEIQIQQFTIWASYLLLAATLFHLFIIIYNLILIASTKQTITLIEFFTECNQ